MGVVKGVRLDSVSWLARYESFSELKRDRIKAPDLPAMPWLRAR